MSLLDDDDVNSPLDPSPIPPVQPLGHVTTNVMSLMEEEGAVICNDTFRGEGEPVSGNAASLSHASVNKGHKRVDSGGGVEFTNESGPQKQFKLAKLLTSRKKSIKQTSKGSKKGLSPPPSPKQTSKAQANKGGATPSSTDTSKVKHRYAALMDESDSADSEFQMSPEEPGSVVLLASPPQKDVKMGANQLFGDNVSGISDLGLELTSPVRSNAPTPPGPPQVGLLKQRPSLPSVGISPVVATAYEPQSSTGPTTKQSNWTSQGQVQSSNTNFDWFSSPQRAQNTYSQPPLNQAAPASGSTSTITSSQSGVPSTDPWTSQAPGAKETKQPTSEGTPVPPGEWVISEEMKQKIVKQFWDLKPEGGFLKGEKARSFFVKSKLPNQELSQIWKLSDQDEDNALSVDEFCVAMKLVVIRRKGMQIPVNLPDQLNPKTANPQVTAVSGNDKTTEPTKSTSGGWANFEELSKPPALSSSSQSASGTDLALPPPPQSGRRNQQRGTRQNAADGHLASSNTAEELSRISSLKNTGHQRSKSNFESTSSAQTVLPDLEQKRNSAVLLGTSVSANNVLPDAPGEDEQVQEILGSEELVDVKSEDPLALAVQEDGNDGSDDKSALYAVVRKPKKSSKKAPKAVHFDSSQDESDQKVDSSNSSFTSNLTPKSEAEVNIEKVTPTRPKPKRPPPPRPEPYRKQFSPPPQSQSDDSMTPTRMETSPPAILYEEVDSSGREESSDQMDGSQWPKPAPRKPAPYKNKPVKEKHGGVKLPGLEVGDRGMDLKVTLAAMKARGHKKTSSLDSTHSGSHEYQALFEGLPPANPPAPPPKPKRSTHLEEPTAPGGRKLSRSASLDSISSLGGATSSVQFQKPDWKASPKLEEKPKKKPIPLPANRVPIHPERKPTISSKPTNVSSESDSSKSQAQPTSKPHPHSTRHHTLASTKRQPVAPNEKQVKKIVDELKTRRPATPPAGQASHSSHPTGGLSHGADVLAVAIAIAEKSEMLPTQKDRSVLRDKTVVQQAIRTLKEEVTTLKETNKELQSKILLLTEERKRLEGKAKLKNIN